MEIRSCAVDGEVTAGVRAVLESAGDWWGIEDHYTCELIDGHEGPHFAMGQSDSRSGDETWLRWQDGGVLEAAVMRACDSTHEEREDGDGCCICVLFDGHPGPHWGGDHIWT